MGSRPQLLASTTLVLLVACAGSRGIADDPAQPPEAVATARTGSEVDGPNELPAEIDIDLSAHGMAARIRAPSSATVHAHENGVVLQSGDDYELWVRRGPLDPLSEKATIVRTYQSSFVRFVLDDGGTVVWETSVAGGSRFHFFATELKQGMSYHCRSGDEGAPAESIIRSMMRACSDLDVVASVE